MELLIKYLGAGKVEKDGASQVLRKCFASASQEKDKESFKFSNRELLRLNSNNYTII